MDKELRLEQSQCLKSIVEPLCIWVNVVQLLNQNLFNNVYVLPFKAPEIIDNFPYSQLCDVWALGIIMFFLYVYQNFFYELFALIRIMNRILLENLRLTGHSPFTADNESKLREQIRKAEINTSSPSYFKLTAEG